MLKSLLPLLLLATGLHAQIVGPSEVTAYPGRLATVIVTITADSAEYEILGSAFDAFREQSSDATRLRIKVFVPTTAKPGAEGYVVIAAVKDGKLLPFYKCRVTVGGTPIPPKPPVPPTPPVPPKPPDPPVPPSPPAPIPVEGLRVLMVYETGDASKTLSLGQRGILFGKSVREALAAKCVKGPDGVTPEFRIYDKDVDASGDSRLWRDAVARTKDKTLPWLIISNGKTGYEGPMPKDAGEFLALVEKIEKDK